MSGIVGEQAMSPLVSIWDDGADMEGWPVPFDAEGVPRQRTSIVQDGVVGTPVYNSYTAGKEGKTSTGHQFSFPSNRFNLERALGRADLLIGAVLIPGRSAPKLVSREMLGLMKPGSVIVDVAVDQGGCFETTRPTTHSDPVYEVDGVVHYCVANMPGAVPRTSTFALNNATLPYGQALADKGVVEAVKADPGLADGVNTYRGHLTCKPVAESQERPYTPLAELL